MNTIKLFFIALMLLTFSHIYAQEGELDGSTDTNDALLYKVEGQVSGSNGTTPLWLNANKYGLSSLKESNGYLLFGVSGTKRFSASPDWSLHYGAELAETYNYSSSKPLNKGLFSSIIIQQLYGELQYKKIRLAIGSKERPANLKNAELSSGSQTLGINARPIPEIRIEAPDYIPILRDNNLLSFKFHFGYGLTTDQNWQKDFVTNGGHYSGHFYYHSKSGFIRIGDEEKFPLVFEGGMEYACQFGGKSYNVYNGTIPEVKGSSSISDFIKAIYGGGSDATDAGYNNAGGNSLGSWLFSLSYKFDNAKIRAYYDHFFEDHSQLFTQYGWKDGLYGCEVTLPENKFVSTFVYEYITTKDQTGPIYHDHTAAVSDQISGVDDYYNNAVYTGWQHWGQAIGNPLFTSPIYNRDHTIIFKNNRFQAHHFGICGTPLDGLHYRLLYSYSTNWGTYHQPFDDKEYNTSFLAEISYAPDHIGRINLKGNSIKCGFGFDKGKLLGNNTGFQITFCRTGFFK